MKLQTNPIITIRTRQLLLFLPLLFGSACSNSGISDSTLTKIDTNSDQQLVLETRPGTPPQVPNMVPHQQLDQNSPTDILEDLALYLFSLEHVEEKSSGISLPSARGAFIKSNIFVNSGINREFTHIHMEPGPGSQHLVLKEKDYLLTNEKGWGIKHPWSDRLTKDGLVLMMIYAPRDENDLDQIKKIINAAYNLALSDG
jgi:hypothetical protein